MSYSHTPFPQSNFAFGPNTWGGETLEEATKKWLSYTTIIRDETFWLSIERDYVLRDALAGIRLLYPKRYPIEVSIRIGELKVLLGEHDYSAHLDKIDSPWKGETLKETAENWLKYVGNPTYKDTRDWTRSSCSNLEYAIFEINKLYPEGRLPLEIRNVCDAIRRCIAFVKPTLYGRALVQMEPSKTYVKCLESW